MRHRSRSRSRASDRGTRAACSGSSLQVWPRRIAPA
jgi:hypothetical protein